MLPKPATCAGCPLEHKGQGFSIATGSGKNGVLLVGEALGRNEALKGEPFVGEAGAQLNRTLQRTRHSRDDFRIFNVVACFPEWTIVHARDIEVAYKRPYRGNLVEVYTSSGGFSVTPNHPILTWRGWVPAAKLVEGDYLIRCSFAEPRALADPHIDNMPASFDEVFDSLSESGIRQGVIGSVMDFHGDGREAEIQIVTTDRLLRNRKVSPRTEHDPKLILKGTHTGQGSLQELCSTKCNPLSFLQGFDPASRCDVGSHSQFLPILWACLLHSKTLCIGNASECSPRLLEGLLETALSNTQLLSQWFNTYPCTISANAIVKIKRRRFSGHVYNLQTSSNDYTANEYIVSNCQPPNNWLEGAPWQDGAVAHCRQHLQKVVTDMKPKVVVPMGGVALKAIQGLDGIMDRHAPKRGYVYDIWPITGIDFLVRSVPTIHPSFVMQGNAKLTGVQAFDLSRAVDVAKNGFKEPDHIYLENPTDAVIEDFIWKAAMACGAGAWMTADIETAYSAKEPEEDLGQLADVEITCISFAFQEHYAISIPWNNHNLKYIQNLLTISNNLVFWNEKFDGPRLKSKGMLLPPNIIDAMYMWHWLHTDLPKSLGFVASLYTQLKEWKSLSDSFPEFYSCRDADAAIQCCYQTRDQLKKEGRFENFMRHYVYLEPILSDMGQAGVCIDAAQKAKFKKEMEHEKEKLNEEIQAAIPSDLRPFKVRRKVPPDAKLGMACRPNSVEVWDCDPVTGEWGERAPFLANSSQQVIRYMRSKGHPVPKNYKTGRDTSGADDIERLAKRYPKDPLYKVLVESREAGKIISQYLNGYEPDADGRLRTTFTQKPSTLRLASEGPNVQNIRKRWALANEYRKMFVPGKGMVLAEFDYKAIEALISGFEAKDDDYMKAARLGVHGILQAHVMGHPLKDQWQQLDEAYVKRTIKELKRQDPRLYDMCKTIVHMSNYGGSARRILMDNPDQFKSTKDAQDLQDVYFKTIGKKIKEWQGKVLVEANSKGHLQNCFGYRHYFYDVYNWNPQSKSYDSWGTDAKRALAFLPQSTAAAIIKEAMLRLGAKNYFRKAMRWQIHDSLIFELHNDHLLNQRMRMIKEEMEKPIQQMNGLSIETEASWSAQSWGQMQEWTTAVPRAELPQLPLPLQPSGCQTQ